MQFKINFKVIIGIIGLLGFIIVVIIFSGNSKNIADNTTASLNSVNPNAEDSSNMADHHSLPATLSPNSSLLETELIGKTAPSFSLQDRDGKVYSLDNLTGKNIILFFNEGLMCYPACWDQIVAFSKDSRFENNNTVVLSVVVDSKEEWQNAVAKMPELAKATVVFDKDGSVSKKFGMLTAPSSMHYGIFPGHTYLIIDRQGIVRHVFDDSNMALHNDQLIEEIKKLN